MHRADRVQPRHAIISCGKNNKYKHPYPETLARLERAGAKVYRTDTQGTIRVMTDGKSLRIAALGLGPHPNLSSSIQLMD